LTPTGTHAVLGARVELAASVAGLDVDLGLVNEAGDHDVVVVLEHLRAEEGTGGDLAGAVSGLGAPRDLIALGVGDERVGRRRSPEAEVWWMAVSEGRKHVSGRGGDRPERSLT
jgi:hypothetical protein